MTNYGRSQSEYRRKQHAKATPEQLAKIYEGQPVPKNNPNRPWHGFSLCGKLSETLVTDLQYVNCKTCLKKLAGMGIEAGKFKREKV